jgi:PIN domain nuclease of toxin-antitoxin system
MKATVLDASALLALLFDQPGAEKMEELFHKTAEADRLLFISAVNWGEVVYKMERKHGQAGYAAAQRFAHTMPLEIVPLDRDLAEAAALLKNEFHLGLADAFAAALAKHNKAELAATDFGFKALEKEIKINWLK